MWMEGDSSNTWYSWEDSENAPSSILATYDQLLHTSAISGSAAILAGKAFRCKLVHIIAQTTVHLVIKAKRHSYFCIQASGIENNGLVQCMLTFKLVVYI